MRAYGDSVLADIEKARARLLELNGYLTACMARMQMTMPETELRSRIRGLVVKPSDQ